MLIPSKINGMLPFSYLEGAVLYAKNQPVVVEKLLKIIKSSGEVLIEYRLTSKIILSFSSNKRQIVDKVEGIRFEIVNQAVEVRNHSKEIVVFQPSGRLINFLEKSFNIQSRGEIQKICYLQRSWRKPIISTLEIGAAKETIWNARKQRIVSKNGVRPKIYKKMREVTKSSKSQFERLPRDLILYIFKFLSVDDLGRLALVDKFFNVQASIGIVQHIEMFYGYQGNFEQVKCLLNSASRLVLYFRDRIDILVNDKRISEEYIVRNQSGGVDHVETVRKIQGRLHQSELKCELNKSLIKYIKAHNIKMVELLVELGADTEAEDSEGVPALSRAAYLGTVDIVEFLIQKKANVNSLANGCYPPLMYAFFSGNIEIVTLLLKNGAGKEINLLRTITWEGEKIKTSILFQAVFLYKIECTVKGTETNKYLEIIQELVAFGADIDQENSLGWTAYDILKMSRENFLKLCTKEQHE